jgi:cytochrome c
MTATDTLPFVIACVALASVQAACAGEGITYRGKSVFEENCSVCHSVMAGKNKYGPSLHGVVGRRAGTIPDFNYSEAMRNCGQVWSTEALNAYIAHPKKVVPGNRMPFDGLPGEKDREDLITFLSSSH